MQTAQTDHAERQRWMQILARAGQDLHGYGDTLRSYAFRHVRQPETGMVMVRGRMGGNGAPFNLGEMCVTRCVVQLQDGTTGYSYVAGRSSEHAELAAVADALLQSADGSRWQAELIGPLQALQHARAALRDSQAAATRVDFTTLVRGED
ncbi:phosphonate C-P lyase system protein PhnG [Alcaligenaceae bacterium]|nr:phosphonate C-P lyase system protein PhnG [Alcaligenaceae bacterium]